MFKKITSIILALTLILSFAGCAQGNTEVTDDPSISSTQSTSTPETKATESTETDKIDDLDKVETDEKLLTIDITLPSSFFQDQDMSTFDTEAYVKENGFIAAKVNEDQSLTVTMTKIKHRALLDEMSASIETGLAEYVEGKDTPYIKEITHNDNFTVVTMKVDRAAYESAFDMMPFVIAMSAGMYQMFLEIESHVEINIVDVATGETFKTTTYPDTLDG